MYYGAEPETFGLACTLRMNMTKAEKILWQQFKTDRYRGLNFRRQHPINIFIVDFYCHKLKLVIEIDGEIHLNPTVKENDENRENMLMKFGLKIIRFRNVQILKDLNSVLQEIDKKIEELT